MVIEKDGFVFEESFNTVKLIGLRHRLINDLVIPEEVNGKLVKIIAPDVFKGITNLKIVCIPDCVEIIGSRAFSHCQNLTRVTVYKTKNPAKILEINDCAFLHCVQITYFSSHVPLFLYPYAFANCKKLENLNTTVIHCGSCVFQNCNKLQQMAFDEHAVWMIDSFSKCANLSTIILNGNLSNSLLKDSKVLEEVKDKTLICKSDFPHLDLVYQGFKIKIV